MPCSVPRVPTQLLAMGSLVSSIAAAQLLRETILTRRWWSCALGAVGIILLSRIWRPEVRPLHGLLANLLFISSFFCEAAYSVLGKPALERVGALKLLASGLVAGTVANVALDLLNGTPTFSALPHLSLQTWLLLAYL